jgi:hypothetical protein
MARTEGMRGMMKGNWTNCVRIIPNSAMKFFTFEQLCRCAARGPCALCADRRPLLEAARLQAGPGAARVRRPSRCVHGPAMTDPARLRSGSRVFSQAMPHASNQHQTTARNTTRRRRPAQPPLSGPRPRTHTHRLISDRQLEATGSGALTPGLRLMAGAGAGIVAMSATYPLDMVRGRLTVQEGRNVQYTGIVHAARTILKEVGTGQGGF